MRIDQLTVTNFRCFAEKTIRFHPNCTLLVGVNGSGKTSILDALSIALGSWFLGITGGDTRHIRQSEVRLEALASGTGSDLVTHWTTRYPCIVQASGLIGDEHLEWQRELRGRSGRTTHVGVRELKKKASTMGQAISVEGQEVTLPLLGYYGSNRLWEAPRESHKVTAGDFKAASEQKVSRLDGYRNSIDPRVSVQALSRWIARQSWISFQRGKEPSLFRVVRQAMVSCVENATNLYFDADYGEVILEFSDRDRQPFNNLSDGQRNILALVGDMSRKAALLNPHLGSDVLAGTPGVIIIDELDLHLHPRWQRRILESLRTTFPKVQFVATTHSPFLIQSLRSGEELILLDGQPVAHLENLPLADIAQGLMGVEEPDVSLRYAAMKGTARHYLEELEAADSSPPEKLADFKEKLAAEIEPYADNPAFQAFLEMKRVAKLGE